MKTRFLLVAIVTSALMVGSAVAATESALMNACTLFAYWGFNTWVPKYLSAASGSGGVGLPASTMAGLIVANQIGTWFGYVTFGYIADAIGRKRTYVAYLVIAALLVWSYTTLRSPWSLLVLGPIASFFATGHFSGFGTVTAELYPTAIRATAQGFTYNVGRMGSALAPFIIGTLAQTQGFAFAFALLAVALLLGASTWIWLPESRGWSAAVPARSTAAPA